MSLKNTLLHIYGVRPIYNTVNVCNSNLGTYHISKLSKPFLRKIYDEMILFLLNVLSTANGTDMKLRFFLDFKESF